jgi:tetratricopeptide (TPR) repeat protein
MPQWEYWDALSGFGKFQSERNCYTEALTLYRRVLKGKEDALGAQHPETLSAVQNFGHPLLFEKGDYEKAKVTLCRAFEGREKVLGFEHPDTLTSAASLAGALDRNGDYLDAELLLRRVIEGRRNVLGIEHSDTIAVEYMLYCTLKNKGLTSSATEARDLLSQLVNKAQKALTSKHLGSWDSRHLMIMTSSLIARGDNATVERVYRTLLDDIEKLYGSEHPETLEVAAKLSDSLLKKGDVAEAETLCRRALCGREKVLGAEHPETLEVAAKLGYLLLKKGDVTEAETLYRRALCGREKVLGAEHPETLKVATELIRLMIKKREITEETESLMWRVLNAKTAYLAGWGHQVPRWMRALGLFAMWLIRLSRKISPNEKTS